MKTIPWVGRFLLPGILLSLPAGPAKAMRFTGSGYAGVAYLQESGAGAPLGKLNVPSEVMAGHCLTMVSPIYRQQTPEDTGKAATVVVRAIIWKSGRVSPMRVVSGLPWLQAEAMNAVRLWQYRPFSRDGLAVDVTTDIRVDFVPGKPGGIVTHPNN